MSSNGFRVELDSAGLAELARGSRGPVVQLVTDITRQGNNIAKLECPVDTGNLRARHEYAVTVQGNEVVGSFGSTADYAQDVHDGHAVRVSASHGGHRVSVNGRTKPNPWLERAARKIGLNIRRTH